MKVLILILFLILPWAIPAHATLLCHEAFRQSPHKKDNYRAYAFGKTDKQSVQRIHIIDFLEPTPNIKLTIRDLKEIVLERERFNAPQLSPDIIDSSFTFSMPKVRYQTRAELSGSQGLQIRRFISRELDRNIIYRPPGSTGRSSLRPTPSRIEYQPKDSTLFLYQVDIITPNRIVELVFTRYTQPMYMDMQAASYALHIAHRLGLKVIKVDAIRIYGGGFR